MFIDDDWNHDALIGIDDGHPFCIQYADGTVQSVDAECMNTYTFIEPDLSLSFNHSNHFILGDIAEQISNTLRCSDWGIPKDGECAIICNNTVSCFDSTFYIDVHRTTALCDSMFSCSNSHFEAASDAGSVHIHCAADSACFLSTISIENVTEFTLQCLDERSCAEMTVNVRNTKKASISCFKLSGCRLQPIPSTHNLLTHRESACDSMTIISDDDTTTLTLHEFSDDIAFETPSGFTESNLQCNPHHLHVALDDKSDEWANTLFPFNLPCSGVHFICNGTESCDIEYAPKYTPESTECHGPLELEEVFNINCIGSCPQSPTSPPTAAPSSDPSSAPTTDPTQVPTKPSYAPTVPPTANTESPSFAPSMNPSVDPTHGPTTYEPTSSPSDAPSASPTRYPVAIDSFDYYVDFVFEIRGLSTENVNSIADRVEGIVQTFTLIIEQGFDNDVTLQFRHIDVSISRLNDYRVKELIDNPDAVTILRGTVLSMESRVTCTEINCRYISDDPQFDETVFDEFVTNKLRIYFERDIPTTDASDDEGLVFYIKWMSSTKELFPASPEYTFYVLIGITSIICSMGFLALLFNKKVIPKMKCCNLVDDGKWMVVIVFGLQFWVCLC